MSRGFAVAGATALMVCCALGASPASAATCASAASVAGSTTLQQAAGSVLCLVNGERAKRGLPAVHASRQLSSSAAAHSRDMVARQYFSHVSPGGGTVRQRVSRVGYLRSAGACKVGETIAWGTQRLATPAQLVQSFMQSAGHRQILLDRSYRDIGIGLVLGAPVRNVPGRGATLTLDFGRR